MARERAGSDIEFDHQAERVSAYLARPAAPRGPGVIAIHEASGLVDHTRDVADRLAREGFVALAPDLYRGKTAATPGEAAQLMRDLPLARAERDLDGAVLELLNWEATQGPRVGVVGFGMGGALALRVAAENARLGAAANFYGDDPRFRVDLAGVKVGLLGIFAEHDESVSAETLREIRAAFESLGQQAGFRVQPDVEHGFMNDSRADVYAPEAARECWGALLAFLRAYLA